MYNNDDMYEVNDYDEDIRTRESLLEEAKQIEESEDTNALFRQLTDLKRRWKRISYWESAYEDKLSEEFDRILDVFYSKRRAGFESVQAVKEDLIHQAKTLAESTQWKQASEGMNNLMAQWKAAGSAGKESDDQLWERFNATRQLFFDRKSKHWEDMQGKFKSAFEVKQQLIKEASTLCESSDWQQTSEKHRELMERWKAVGSAGRDQEDALWQQFQEERQKFFDRRNEYYEAQRDVQAQKYEAKSALVARANAIKETKEYTKEHTAEMKKLGVDWKEIGSCGKENEDKVWNAFRSAMDTYFEGLKKWNEQKHLQWRQRLMDARAHKLEIIQNQKRQIKHMEQDIVGLIGERAILEMEEEIQDKNEFIKQLEEELFDIDKTLQES